MRVEKAIREKVTEIVSGIGGWNDDGSEFQMGTVREIKFCFEDENETMGIRILSFD